jgi:rsbT co-antagonist protein RsbR
MNMIGSFSTYINENVDSLALEVVEGVVQRMKLDIPEWEKEQALSMYVQFFSFLGESCIYEGDDIVPDSVIQWSKRNAAMQVTSSGEISEIVVRYPPTREIFNEIVTRISIDLGLSVKENALIIKRINTMLDISLSETVYAFECFLNVAREETQKQMAALSAPLIPIKDDTVILPLIGDIDSYRANYLMEKVVPKIAELDINHVIVDFSGIFKINEDIAELLHQISSMFQLMGIHVITTGLRPELAKAIVNSRINFAEIETFANVKTALLSIK